MYEQSDILTPDIVEKFRVHALECYPEECCAFVTHDLQYVPLNNVSDNPTQTAKVSTKDQAHFYDVHGKPLAFLHSHPDGPNCPSLADMRSQVLNAIPYGIMTVGKESWGIPFMWGSMMKAPPLLGRPYRYAVTDCFALARDYYHSVGIPLVDVPRGWKWWDEGLNLFVDSMKEAKFTTVLPRDLELGDAVLFRTTKSSVPTHCGVYLGKGMMLHQPASLRVWDPTKLSCHTSIDRWMQVSTHCLRYTG